MPRHGGPEVLELREVERPAPAPGEVLIRVAAAGVNPVDTQVRSGEWVLGEMGAPPMTLGWDVAGTIEEVGEGVSEFAAGDRVFGMPRFPAIAACDADFVAAPAREIAVAPASLTDEQAGALPLAGLTAWQALVGNAEVGEGDRVLIQAAAGGVGHLPVQIAKARGGHVIGTARADRHDFLRELGVDEPIDYTAGPVAEAVSPVDVVIDLVSEDDAGLLASLRALGGGGRLVVIAGDLTDEITAVAREQGTRAVEMLVSPDRVGLESLAALADEGGLRVETDEAFPLAQAADAHRSLEHGRARGKIVLVP
ncbi:MAG TPA: NADP-dependent oxidoreductase [Solirubrobacterales bacterium]|nr:NADP-dependent oxidoreductase [Solirubrobacterales bacterium]